MTKEEYENWLADHKDVIKALARTSRYQKWGGWNALMMALSDFETQCDIQYSDDDQSKIIEDIFNY